METYRKTLILLKDLLHKSGNSHWEQWIDRDIYEWDYSKETSHHKSAFGGMGSINDLAVGRRDKVGIWANNMFVLLKNISWTFAAKNKLKFPATTITNIEGAICRNCSYAEVSEISVESYLSNTHLPTIIANLLPTEQYLELTNIDKLTDKIEVVRDRQQLLTALPKSEINFLTSDNGLTTCPTCNSANTCVYRWDVSKSEDRFIVTRSKNNLKINADKTKTTWWKRLMGYS